jgi:hypothetical protein
MKPILQWKNFLTSWRNNIEFWFFQIYGISQEQQLHPSRPNAALEDYHIGKWNMSVRYKLGLELQQLRMNLMNGYAKTIHTNGVQPAKGGSLEVVRT